MEMKPWHKHWPKGQPWSLNYPEVTADIFLKSAAFKYPDRVALVFMGAEYTYAELWEKARRFAAALADMGIGKGDVVSLHLPNCPQFAIAYYGIFIAGATFSPANPLLSQRELEYQLHDCGARAIVTFDLFAAPVMEVRPRTKIEQVIITNGLEAVEHQPMDMSPFGNALSFQKLLAEYPPDPPAVTLNPRVDLAHLAYTGGTTGLSKGVMLTHYNVVVNVLQYGLWSSSGEPVVRDGILYVEKMYQNPPGEHWEFIQEEGEGVTVNVTPWFHAMGTIGYLNILFMSGTTVITHPRFDPVAYLDDAEKYGATSIGGAPPLFLAMLNTPGFAKRNFSKVKRLSSGAAPLAVDLLQKLSAAFPEALVVEAYGLTEVTMGATANPANRSGLRKVGTVGIPVYDTEVKIVDLETGTRELPCGEEGEICVRGPQCMLGYYHKPEATAEVLRDGWVYTGDIGRMDEDGYVCIVDRKKDMLIYKGYNVYPRELEELLFQHPAVASCTVIGIPDPEVGEWPKAFVVRQPGLTISETSLMDYVNSQVVPYKKLREVEFVEEIPVSAAGKVLKRLLREREMSRRAAGGA